MSLNQCSSVCKLADVQCNTDVQLHEVKFLWTINNFNFHEAIGKKLVSPTFSAATNRRVKWVSKLEPDGTTDDKNTISFSVHLSRSSTYDFENEKIFSKMSVSVLDSEEIEIRCSPDIDRASIHEYGLNSSENERKTGWRLKEFLKKDFIFKQRILSNNKLVIICTIVFSVVPNVSNTLHQCQIAPLYPNILECNVVGNFEKLLANHKFADIVISVKSTEYPAHKAILAVRSSVFAAMFEHNFKENESNRIEIEDSNEEVVAEMLRYIYTGKCEISEELVDGLLAAADKYNLGPLKMMCAEKLYQTLSTENATNVLALADLHSVAELKTETIRFISDRFAEVVVSTAWKNILVSHPDLIDQVCQDVAGRLRTAKKRSNQDMSSECKKSRIE